MREDVTFGGGCAGWHYRTGSATTVVMAHGFGATRSCGLEPFAEGFAAAGYDVLLFDYRGFGDSAGEPRQVVDFARQRDDYRAAVAHARAAGAERIVLWGASLAGGHVLEVAGRDPSIDAVVAVTPSTDNLATARWGLDRTAPALTAAALRGRRIPIAGPPGSVAVINAPGAYERYLEIAGKSWVNEVHAGVMLKLGLDRPARYAKKLRMPVLMLVCDEDRTVPAEAAMKTAWDARAEVRHYPGDHFDVYPGGPFHERAVEHTLLFLNRHLARR